MKQRRAISLAEVQEVIERLRPALRNEGGEIELLEVSGGDARVSLQGHFTDCVASTLLLRFGIERALREAIPDFGELRAEVRGSAGGTGFSV